VKFININVCIKPTSQLWRKPDYLRHSKGTWVYRWFSLSW